MTDDTRLDHADRDMDLGEASSSAAPHGCGGPLSPASSCGASSHAVEADAANGLSASFGDAARLPRRMHGYAMEESVLEDADESNGATGKACSKTPLSAPLLSRSEGHLCVRHQRMADEGANARLQKVRMHDASMTTRPATCAAAARTHAVAAQAPRAISGRQEQWYRVV